MTLIFITASTGQPLRQSPCRWQGTWIALSFNLYSNSMKQSWTDQEPKCREVRVVHPVSVGSALGSGLCTYERWVPPTHHCFSLFLIIFSAHIWIQLFIHLSIGWTDPQICICEAFPYTTLSSRHVESSDQRQGKSLPSWSLHPSWRGY